MHGNSINPFQHFKRQKGRGGRLPFSPAFFTAFSPCLFRLGALKRLPLMSGGKPFETSEAKKSGRKGGKFEFPALSPAFLPFEMLERINSVPMHFNGKWYFNLQTFQCTNIVPKWIKFISRGTTVLG